MVYNTKQVRKLSGDILSIFLCPNFKATFKFSQKKFIFTVRNSHRRVITEQSHMKKCQLNSSGKRDGDTVLSMVQKTSWMKKWKENKKRRKDVVRNSDFGHYIQYVDAVLVGFLFL